MLNNRQVSEIVNIAAKAGYDITRADVERVMESGYCRPLWSAPCDCGDRIMHWNGGNYHATLEMKISSDWLLVYESSTSESFPGDGETLIFVTGNGEWSEGYSLLADDADYDEADFFINDRRDKALGLVKR